MSTMMDEPGRALVERILEACEFDLVRGRLGSKKVQDIITEGIGYACFEAFDKEYTATEKWRSHKEKWRAHKEFCDTQWEGNPDEIADEVYTIIIGALNEIRSRLASKIALEIGRAQEAGSQCKPEEP